jgi:hypothetical protein
VRGHSIAQIELPHAGEKLTGANDELLVVALQHQRGFAGSQSGAPLNQVRLALKRHRTTRFKGFQLFMILLWIDSIHERFNSIADVKP